MEYANAQLECNAADERAKLLASEVIGLEEKVNLLRYSVSSCTGYNLQKGGISVHMMYICDVGYNCIKIKHQTG